MSEHVDWSRATADDLATAGSPWLEGKVALVAGGGMSGPEGGVGFGMAWLFAREGAAVAVLDRDPEAAGRAVDAIIAAGGRAQAFEVDLTSGASVETAVGAAADALGPIDVVGNSLGGGGTQPVLEATEEEWDRAMDVNLKSAWLLMKHVAPRMADGGSIVCVSSGAVEGRGPGLPYTVAKTALEKLCIGAAGSLAPRGIRVNCIRVGMIWGAFAAKGLTQEKREFRAKNVALGVEGTAWDIAAAALFLSTRQARWVSGQVLAVDGGGTKPPYVGQAGQKKDDA